jgi:hypothetical protein
MDITDMYFQERLEFYTLAEEAPWGTKWTMPEHEMYTALLLEVGYPPKGRDHRRLMSTPDAARFEDKLLTYYHRIENALDKYYNPTCHLPVEIVTASACDSFITWALAEGENKGVY